jgi:aspartate/methionine/tyrosine aminotransferase
MRIRPFGIEQWMNEWETRCRWNLAETCVDSLTVAELLELAGAPDLLAELGPMRLGYGDIEGSGRLRAAIAALYERQGPGNVLVTHGAIGANHLVHATLVEPGDRVVTIVPTYQQHASIPESLGADVRLLWLREERGFQADLDELRDLVGGSARLIAVTNPNNPTGALLDRSTLEAIVSIADEAGAWLLCDEVYRGLDQDEPGTTASVVDLYARGISTGSMSKAFSLAGLRLGWIAGPGALLRDVSVHRDYTTISVGMVDDRLATLALEHVGAVLGRSRRIVRGNLAILEAWARAQPRVSWVKPRSGTTALLRVDTTLPSRELCVRLIEETGVMLTPGSAMDMEGYLRIGYANDRAILEAGLERMDPFRAELP